MHTKSELLEIIRNHEAEHRAITDRVSDLCDLRCMSWGLEQRESVARSHGSCPCWRIEVQP